MEASVRDMTGRNVFSSQLKPGPNKIDIHADHEGIYTIHLTDHNHTIIYTQKFSLLHTAS